MVEIATKYGIPPTKSASSSFGIAPSVVLSLVKTLWDRKLRKIFTEAERAAERDAGPGDICLYLAGPHLLGNALGLSGVPNVNACQLSALPGNISMVMAEPTNPQGLPPRVMAVNLSARLRSFHHELATTWLEFEGETTS